MLTAYDFPTAQLLDEAGITWKVYFSQIAFAAYQAAVLRSEDGGDTFFNVFSPHIDTKGVVVTSGSSTAVWPWLARWM